MATDLHRDPKVHGSNVSNHLTGSGAQSLWCLLPIFDPDGVGQNPLDFSPFRRVGLKDESASKLKILPKLSSSNFYLHNSYLLSLCGGYA